MSKTNTLNRLLRSHNTVFTFKEILLSSGETNPKLLRRRISYYLKKGQLYPIRRGLYAKDKNYNKLEVATKIFTPSYVSFETVLTKAGIVFQYYNQTFIASYISREIVVDRQTYSYKRMKDAMLTNPEGIEQADNYAIASPERAFLDVIYLSSDYHFDNVSGLNWSKVYKILPIYGGNKRMERIVKQYQKIA